MKEGKEIARKNQAQKSEEIRTALFQAAAEVVGEFGYADASISKITQKNGRAVAPAANICRS